jgi:hypothetical protein
MQGLQWLLNPIQHHVVHLRKLFSAIHGIPCCQAGLLVGVCAGWLAGWLASLPATLHPHSITLHLSLGRCQR